MNPCLQAISRWKLNYCQEKFIPGVIAEDPAHSRFVTMYHTREPESSRNFSV